MLIIKTDKEPKTLKAKADYVKQLSNEYHGQRVVPPDWVQRYMVYNGTGYTIRINGEACANYQKTDRSKIGVLYNFDRTLNDIHPNLHTILKDIRL